MFSFFKKQQPQEQPKESESFFNADIKGVTQQSKTEIYQNAYASSVQVKPSISKSGMDSAIYNNAFVQRFEYGINPLIYKWYASNAFIGFQTMGIMAQHGMISKACSIPAKDAIRKGWQVTSQDGEDLDPKITDKIAELDKKFRIKEKLVNQSYFTKVYGIRIAVFDIEHENPEEFYKNPFNIDGVKKNSYKGIKQIDPYWITPDLTGANLSDPTSLDFYEPTYWISNGRKYHKSHLIITRGEEVADILKPSYQYAGLSLTQKVYQRLYAAERIADEVPNLALSKRLNIFKMSGMSKIMSNFTKFKERMNDWLAYRDNYGIKFADKEDEISQIDTSLADLDVNIMTQFQLFCALVNIPSYKMLNAPMKGFSSGETEESSYHEELENIQDYTLTPLLDRHYEILIKSEGIEKFNPTIIWNELDSVTERERAEINNFKATELATLSNAGLISQEDASKTLIQDPTSSFYNMEMSEPEEYDLSEYDNTQDGMDYIEKENDLYYVYSENGEKLSKGYKSKIEAKKRLREIEYFANDILEEITEETQDAKYQGKEVELNKPFRTPNESKKFGVYVQNDKGNVILVRFGDSNMEIKRDDKESRENFRARHNCEEKTDKTKAGYWSCKFWSSKSVSELLKD